MLNNEETIRTLEFLRRRAPKVSEDGGTWKRAQAIETCKIWRLLSGTAPTS